MVLERREERKALLFPSAPLLASATRLSATVDEGFHITSIGVAQETVLACWLPRSTAGPPAASALLAAIPLSSIQIEGENCP
jgi:hypothetical protein